MTAKAVCLMLVQSDFSNFVEIQAKQRYGKIYNAVRKCFSEEY